MGNTTDKQDLEARLDQIESELEDLRDRISELLIERNKVADQLDDIIDREENGFEK